MVPGWSLGFAMAGADRVGVCRLFSEVLVLMPRSTEDVVWNEGVETGKVECSSAVISVIFIDFNSA